MTELILESDSDAHSSEDGDSSLSDTDTDSYAGGTTDKTNHPPQPVTWVMTNRGTSHK